MPVKVFNQSFGRDEEKVFGENTDRRFESIDVPSVEEVETLKEQLQQLQGMSAELCQLQAKDAQTLIRLSERMLDREHAEQIVADLKSAIADTSVFSNALLEALDSHEQRLQAANEKTLQALEAIKAQTADAALATSKSLDATRHESAATLQQLSIKLVELENMLELSKYAQTAIHIETEKLALLQPLNDWAKKMQKGGFWARLVWLIRG